MILNRVFSMDRYGLAREFELRKFEMHVMKMTDLYQVQEIAIKLFSQTMAQRRVYRGAAAGHEGAATGQVSLRTCFGDRYADCGSVMP